jgi:hypothetical protein
MTRTGGPYPLHRAFKLLSAALFAVLLSFDAGAFHIKLFGSVTEHFTGNALKGVEVRLVKDSIER